MVQKLYIQDVQCVRHELQARASLFDLKYMYTRNRIEASVYP